MQPELPDTDQYSVSLSSLDRFCPDLKQVDEYPDNSVLHNIVLMLRHIRNREIEEGNLIIKVGCEYVDYELKDLKT